MEPHTLSYREVITDQSNQDKWNEIALNTGGTQSTLQDIKVAEKAGGYCFSDVTRNNTRNRFIYWRTYHDILELSEVSLDFTLYNNNVRYKFTDSPVLSVVIVEQANVVTILVTTVSSLHRLNFSHPDKVSRHDVSESKSLSIFHDANANMARDPTTFYVIGQATSSNNPIPHAATGCLSATGEEAYFAVAYQSSLMLFGMNCQTGHTVSNVLKEHHIMPRIFSNIRGALGGKSNTTDSQYATSLVFSKIDEQAVLLALYRDDHIRMWSTNSLQCIFTLNCVRDGSEVRSQGPQTSILRKVDDNSVCAFLSHSTGSEFVNVRVSSDGGSSYTLVRTKVIPAPQSDLADFEVSKSRIWALWCNAQGEFSISSFSLVPSSGINWISAAMEPPPDRYSVSVEQGMDPRQAFCSYIFHPGKFQKSVIAKALIMFKRSNMLFDANVPLTLLKDRVCQAVESEIQSEVIDYEISDDEYIDIATRYWERFYSCCEQYHLKSCQPTGLVLLEAMDAVCVVKKNAFSLLRPCEILEHLMLAGENVEMETIVPLYFKGNESAGEDMVQLVTTLEMLEHWLSDENKTDFDKKLYHLELPNEVVSKLVTNILSSDQGEQMLPSNFLVTLRQNMQSINDIRSAMAMLLELLRMDHGNPEAMRTHHHLVKTSHYYLALGNLFGSLTGVSLLAESVRQVALIRYSLCRNLLILQQIIIDTFSMQCDVMESIRSQFMPETVSFVQSYYVMVWTCETPLNLSSMTSVENSIQRLNLLQLADTRPQLLAQVQSSTLLRIFLGSKGLNTALILFSGTHQEIESMQWQFTLLPIVTIINQLIWPISGNFVFGEWLFSSCQHLIIQEYVRLLNTWCEWNNCSRQFILAVSLLENGETHKAYDLFLQSAKGVLNEEFVNEKILKTNDELTSNEILAQYYLKVIQLFEQHYALDYVIALAQVAISILEKTDPQLPMFQSIVFNNHLALEHYEEAYHALIYNADPSRRKDCLRQLVVCLFNRRRLDLLLHFPYVGLQDEFENIVESRARSMSVEDNEHYNFLYSFHITKGNMRKASSIMYEQAMRYVLECDAIESMELRCECLLACLNALHLVDEKYRWIAKPVVNDDNAMHNGMDLDEGTPRDQVVVLEIDDINREYLQTDAFLQLAKRRRDIGTFFNTGPNELSVILANTGLYTSALKLAKGFKISVLPIFDGLTAACIRSSDESPNETWTWLQENDLADLPYKNTAADTAWALLQNLVEEHEEENSTLLRKSVANKLFSLNSFIPQWLQSSYKFTNPSEFLRLLVKHGRLIEATEFAKEYIWAILGRGHEYFNLKVPLTAASPAMCIPLNTLDLLLYGLKLNSEDIEYKQCHTELEELIQCYIDTANRTSADKIQYEYQVHAIA